jgi:hypothetical protein
MSGIRVQGQQAESRGDLLQYISREAASALTYEVAPDLAEVFFRLWRQ